MSHVNYNMGGPPGKEDLGALHSQIWSALQVLDGPAWASASSALGAAALEAQKGFFFEGSKLTNTDSLGNCLL